MRWGFCRHPDYRLQLIEEYSSRRTKKKHLFWCEDIDAFMSGRILPVIVHGKWRCDKCGRLVLKQVYEERIKKIIS